MGNNNKGVGVGVRTAGTKGGGQPWKSNKTGGGGGEATTVKEDLTTGGEGRDGGRRWGGNRQKKNHFFAMQLFAGLLKTNEYSFCVVLSAKPVPWFLPPQE